MLHVIVTRFSFRFRKDDLVDKLLSPERLDNRITTFKDFCFPSITGQNTTNFYWILIVDPLLPIKYRQKLLDLIELHKTTTLLLNKGPKDIILHDWDWDINKLENIDWILKYFDHKPKYLITTRLDDDDALIYNFVKTIQSKVTDNISPFRYYSYAVGWHFYVKKNSLRISKSIMIALGLSLITDISKYPMCVYLGNHTRIPKYLRNPELHPKIFALYKRNNDLPATPEQFKRRIEIITGGEPVWIRTIHDFNLQKNLKKQHFKQKNPQIERKVKNILKTNFNLNL